MKDTNRTILGVMAAIALLMGLYLVFIAPGFFDSTMDQLILKQSKQATNLTAGPLSRLYIGSIYSGIEMLAGLVLIVISPVLYKGKKWAWPLAVLMLSIPAMVNGFIGLGWLENLKRFPPAYITFFLSLIAFWVMLLLKKNDGKTKIAMFIVFTLLGMLGAQAFMLYPHAVRVILKDPAAALLDPTAAILRRTGPLMFSVFILSALAIWKLAQRKESGWYLALLSGLAMAIGAFPVHYLRPTASLVPADTLAPSVFTSAYWMAGAQGVILVILLLIPFFKSRLYDKEE
jgi:ribose/xylose/arabinose/galactoside ABC-type transport system permease subunit